MPGSQTEARGPLPMVPPLQGAAATTGFSTALETTAGTHGRAAITRTDTMFVSPALPAVKEAAL